MLERFRGSGDGDEQLVLNAMSRFEGSFKVQESGCFALGHLVENIDNRRDIGIDGCKAVIKAISQHRHYKMMASVYY
jgi:hypothetical protein